MMANLFHIVITVVLVASCSSTTYLDHLVSVTHRQPYELVDSIAGAVCNPGDFFCDVDCAAVKYCIDANTSVTVETCAPPATLCNADSRKCEADITCTTPPDVDRFVCHDLGYFPDPFDCQIYHLCGPDPESAPIFNGTCTGSSAYNPLTTQCSLTLTDRVCIAGPIDKCTTAGQIGAQIENPNIYYICVKEGSTIFPSLYRCPDNQVFVGTKCVDPSVTTQSTTVTTGDTTVTGVTVTSTDGTGSTTVDNGSTTVDNGSSTDVTVSTTSATTTKQPFVCNSQGTFADPADCYSYYLCPASLEPVHFRCQEGYHYIQGRGCVRGNCD